MKPEFRFSEGKRFPLAKLAKSFGFQREKGDGEILDDFRYLLTWRHSSLPPQACKKPYTIVYIFKYTFVCIFQNQDLFGRNQMKRFSCRAVGLALSVLASTFALANVAKAQEQVQADKPGKQAIERSRRTVQTLDNIFKQTIVLVTDKYVNDDDDFAAGSAAVLLFQRISEGSDNTIRLIDATGDPYEPKNVAKDEFEKSGIAKLKQGAKTVDEVVTKDGKHYLRALTPVPVVMDKCIMCHSHYADVKPGAPIGAISYTVPID